MCGGESNPLWGNLSIYVFFIHQKWHTVTKKFEDIGPRSMVVTGTGISRNGRYLAVLQPADQSEGHKVRCYAEKGNIVSVYDTVSLQFEWTCDVNRCDYLAINDNGSFLFVITHRMTLLAYECQVKEDGVKVVVKQQTSSDKHNSGCPVFSP